MKNIDLKNIKSLFNKKRTRKVGDRSVATLWIWVIGSAFLVSVGFLIWSSVLFARVEKNEAFSPTENEPEKVVTIDREALESVLSDLKAVADRFDSIRASGVNLANPGL